MNISTLRGYLTADPELKILDDVPQTVISRFTLAVPDRTHKNEEGNYDADFIRIITFGKRAETVQTYLSKGSEVIVVGKIHTYRYTNKDGQTSYGAEIIANSIEFVSKCSQETELSFMENTNYDELPFK